MQFLVLQLSTTCSIPKLPQSQLYSVHSTKANRPIVLVIQQEDKCGILESILKAKSKGFNGIIFCADTIERFRNIKPIEGFYVSVILNNDRFSLQKYNEPR